MAGVCRAPSGADGCNGGSAHELSLREVSAYQTVKIPLMQKAAAIAMGQRVADVVEARATLFRVFVDPSTAFQPRQISARLTLTSDTGSDQYFAKQQVSKASSDADTASTFQLFVPADKIQASTSYSVELVECATGTGSLLAARFPATGVTPLQTRKTGVLKVTLIPVTTNSSAPDTSDAVLTNYRSYLEAMYPIEKAELTVGTPITTAYPINWTTLVEQIRTQRQTDHPAADVYYFGIVKPLPTLREYCKGGCTAGIGYVGADNQPASYAAVGLAFGDETSAATLAHEVGHNHGRNHAPCAPGNNISGVDAKYPYTGAQIGTWGYDPRKQTFFDPTKTFDIMGYCDPKWISDYTYKGLMDRVATLNAAKLELSPEELNAAYQVLLVDQDGPRWSQPFSEPAAPFGIPEMAEALDIDGHPVAQVTVYRTLLSDLGAATILVPEPEPGWNAIRVAGALALPFSAPITVPAPE
jgi:Peptidase M66